MPTKIGQFEILSELSKSPTGSVYKANDPEGGQTIALKAVQLSAFGEHASAVEQALLREIERIKVLGSPNLCTVTTASIIDGQFCAAMEYVQGNSIATMLARKEGFSIWDLLDIGRQLCCGLDHASTHQIAHHSLEPSKIMCGWDGTVKILSYGTSDVGNFVHHVNGHVSSILHYMSPEQVRGESTDLRSNLFSLGAIFYEMVTERKAFDREDIDSLRQSILETTPVPPIHVNPKVHPLLSDLIMKALQKDPAQRYQVGKELLDDLEKCKETRPAAKKTVTPKPAAVTPESNKAAAKFVTLAAQTSQPSPTHQPAAASAPAPVRPPVVNKSESSLVAPKSAAAAAGAGATSSYSPKPAVPGNQPPPESYMSSATIDESQVEAFETSPAAPKIAVDPLMAESAPASTPSGSFSEISELPPLKEVYVAPEPPPDLPAPPLPKFTATTRRGSQKPADRPKIQPREVAGKAIKEIKGVPPKLMMYALAGAAVLILAIGIGVGFYIHSQSDDDSGGKRAAAAAPVQTPAPQPKQAVPQPEATAPVQPQAEAEPAEVPDDTPAPVAEPPSRSKLRAPKRRTTAAVVAPGQLSIDSTPSGAQVQLDGNTDPSWVTPLALTNLQPGKHSITISKSGYAPDTRSVDVASGAKATAIVHLAQLMATLIVKSDPPGANIYIDSKDVGARTPAQVSVGKGQHMILVRKEGYLDETMNAQLALGQTLSFSPTLQALGNVDNIKTVGKMSKLFGKKGSSDQGTISIHTQPKGAQVAINQHILEKSAPVDVMLDPGNYVIDVMASGYAPIHRVVIVQKGAKVVVDDIMQAQ